VKKRVVKKREVKNITTKETFSADVEPEFPQNKEEKGEKRSNLD
jgi:hypothetical protein